MGPIQDRLIGAVHPWVSNVDGPLSGISVCRGYLDRWLGESQMEGREWSSTVLVHLKSLGSWSCVGPTRKFRGNFLFGAFEPSVRVGGNKIKTGRTLFGYRGLGDFIFRVLTFPCLVVKWGGSSVSETPKHLVIYWSRIMGPFNCGAVCLPWNRVKAE